MSAIDPAVFVREELYSNDIKRRLTCISRLDGVSRVLSSCDILIPLLSDYSKRFEDDDGLLAIAKKLPSLKGSIQSTHLLPLLEDLMRQDETVIREAAVMSVSEISSSESADFSTKHVAPLLNRLFTDTWFSARVSACSLLPLVYGSIKDESVRTEIRKNYLALFEEDTPMVRRAAGIRLAQVLKVVGSEIAYGEGISVLKKIASDETQESLRLAAVQCLVVLTEVGGKGAHVTSLRPILQALAKDKSWRVRMVLARQIDVFCAAFGDDIARSELLPLIVGFLKDLEADVRQAAVNVLPKTLPFFTTKQVASVILPEVVFLCADGSVAVRSEVASLLPGLLIEVGEDEEEEDTPSEKSPRAAVLALIQEVFKDENFLVRTAAVSGIPKLCKMADSKTFVLPLVALVASDIQWRVRLAVIEQLPALANAYGRETFEKEQALQAALLAGFSDSVFAVREEVIKKIPDIVNVLGVPWLTDKLWPKIREQYNPNSSYLNRMTVLHAIKVCSRYFSASEIETNVAALLLQGLNDSVANVQLCACVALDASLTALGATGLAMLVDPLRKLALAKDKDVSFYAHATLSRLPNKF